MSEKGLEILGWTFSHELQPRFHPLGLARAEGDQIVISTSGLNPPRRMRSVTRRYTHTQAQTCLKYWAVISKGRGVSEGKIWL